MEDTKITEICSSVKLLNANEFSPFKYTFWVYRITQKMMSF